MKQLRPYNLPPITLDPSSAEPLYFQLCAALRRAIRDGSLPTGSRLPSTRVAAQLLGVSRTTVLTAYETLLAENQIESVIGSGTRVCGKRIIPPMQGADWRSLIREAHYPLRTTRFQDPDGNVHYLNHG